MGEQIKPIRTNGNHDDAMVRKHHAEIERRLEQLGHDAVKHLRANAGFPTQWDLIVDHWLMGNRLEPGESDE